jgi:hypothetical protein
MWLYSRSCRDLAQPVSFLHFFILEELNLLQSPEYTAVSSILRLKLNYVFSWIIRHILSILWRQIFNQSFPHFERLSAAHSLNRGKLLLEQVHYETENALMKASLWINLHEDCRFLDHNFLNLIQ